MKKGLTTTQLKVIAILAMVIDHCAWGFVDMFSVQGQIMHVIGRLTIPIMCFFIAEGYRKTHNLKHYIYKLIIYSMFSIVPFYLFFGEEYGYRQNIIFDLLLALLTLSILESKDIKRGWKIILTALLVITSATVGGWPVLPILFVLIFYYGKSFKQKAILVTASVLLVETFVVCAILMNNVYHFSDYDWVWYQWMYFLGFVLALPLLYLYNGEKGTYPFGKRFFYIFYPMHFLVLYCVKCYFAQDYYTPYLLLNVVCLAMACTLVIRLINVRPSRALVLSVLLGFSAIIYIFGFILEILTSSVDIAYAGTILEYFGECLVFMSFLMFTTEMCHKKIPSIFYLISILFSVVIVTMIMTTRETHFFYTNIGMDSSGPFTRLDLSYGPGFFFFVAYMVLVCGASIIIGILSLSQFRGIERKRIILILIAVICPWLAFLAKLIGITGGYEVSAIGVLGSLFFISRSIMHYGYFDSIQLAGENALHHFSDGIIVVDSMDRIVYINKVFAALFPEVAAKKKATQYLRLLPLLDGTESQLKRDNRIYDISITPLVEEGYTQGRMITIKDMTEHYEHLAEAERFAHTDALTGLSNRKYFKQCFDEFRAGGGIGTMLMFDLDNFKGVNDHYGHGVGDKVLITLAETIVAASEEKHLSCRIGGDEYCMFLKDVITQEGVGTICSGLISDFAVRLAAKGYEGITSISIGAAILATNEGDLSDEDFTLIYKEADGALYIAKNSGKAQYRIAE